MRPNREWVWVAEVVRWVDGDSVDLLVDRGFRDSSLRRIRLLGIDTPETRGLEATAAMLATQRAVALAPPGSRVVIVTHKDPRGLDKYGRWLAEVWPADEALDQSVNQVLLAEGLARPY